MSKATDPTTPSKSWRDVINVHPAADLFPMMSPDQLKALGEDIRQHGMSSPIVWWCEREADIGKTPSPKYQLLDGRNRLDAMEMVGIEVIDLNGREPVFHNMVWEDIRYGEGVPRMNAVTGNRSVERTDPYEYVLSANMHRRHLTGEQKREIVAKLLKVQPEKSNRQIAKQAKVDDKTVGGVRRELEERAEIPHVSTIEDTKGRRQPTKKARRTADDFIANRKAQAMAVAELVELKQSDIERVLPDADRLVHKIMAWDAIAPRYALAVARGIAAHLGDSYPEMPGFLKRTAEPTAPGAHLIDPAPAGRRHNDGG